MLAYTEIKGANSASTGGDLPVVVLHGVLTSKETMEDLCKLIASKKIYLVDLPSHGESPNSRPVTISHMADMVLSFLKTLGNPRVFLIGHSLGGQVAMAAALRDQSGLIAGLAILDISPVNYYEEPTGLHRVAAERNIVEAFQLLKSLDISDIKDKSQAVTRLISLEPQLTEAAAEDMLYLLHEKPGGAGMEWKMDLAGLCEALENEDLRWDIPSVQNGTKPFTGPVVCVRGGKSPWVCEERHLPVYKTFFPQATMHTIEEARHRPYVGFANEVAEFINMTLERAV